MLRARLEDIYFNYLGLYKMINKFNERKEGNTIGWVMAFSLIGYNLAGTSCRNVASDIPGRSPVDHRWTHYYTLLIVYQCPFHRMHSDDISPVTSPGGLPVGRYYALLV